MRRAPSTVFVKARRWFIRCLLVTFIVVAGPVVAFGARLNWTFELASHFRTQYCWCLLVATSCLALLEQWVWSGIAGALLIVHVLAILPFYLPRARSQGGKRTFRVLSLNVRRSNDRHTRTISFVRSVRPDLAVFLEVDDDWYLSLARLSDLFSYSRVMTQPDSRGIAIFSRIPLDDSSILYLADDVPVIRVTMTSGPAQIHLFGIHPYPPVSKQMAALRDRQMLELMRSVIETNGQKIVIGDFNMTSWSPAFGAFTEKTGLRDTRCGRGVQSTWPARLPALLRIPIDHCLVSRGLDVVDRQTGLDVGSDHLPIIVDLSLKQAFTAS